MYKNKGNKIQQKEEKQKLSARKQEQKKQMIKKKQEEQKQMNKKKQQTKQKLMKKKKKPFFLSKYSYHFIIGIVVLVLIYGIFQTVSKSSTNIYTTDSIDLQYIQNHNKKQLSFKLGPNDFFKDWKLVQAKKIMKNINSNKASLLRCQSSEKNQIIPQSYNFYQKYSECQTLIKNQGKCSSSYSIASVGAISDRLCKHYKKKIQMSYMQPIACDKIINENCKGGYITRVFDYSKLHGLVKKQCLQYNETGMVNNCSSKIRDCQKFKISDYCVVSTQQSIKQQIYSNGPVVTTIPIYRDFLMYKNGSYFVLPYIPRFENNHAIKIIGWKIINNQNVWIIENSWGQTWGQNGFGQFIFISYLKINSQDLKVQNFVMAPILQQKINQQQNEQVLVKQLQQQQQQLQQQL